MARTPPRPGGRAASGIGRETPGAEPAFVSRYRKHCTVPSAIEAMPPPWAVHHASTTATRSAADAGAPASGAANMAPAPASRANRRPGSFGVLKIVSQHGQPSLVTQMHPGMQPFPGFLGATRLGKTPEAGVPV